MNNFDEEPKIENPTMINKLANGTKNVVTGTVSSVGYGLWWAGASLISVGGSVMNIGSNPKQQKKPEIDELTGQQLAELNKNK